jgi:hypothetical protein
MSLLNNYDVLNKKQVQINKNLGKFGGAIKAQAKTASAKWSSMVADLQRTGIKIGNAVIPFVESLAHWIGKLADKFSSLSPHTQKVIEIVALVVAAIGPLLSIGAKLITVVKLIGSAMSFLAANPIVAIVLAIGLIVIALIHAYNTSKTFRKIVHEALHAIVTAAKAVGHFFTHDIPAAFHATVHGLSVAWDAVVRFLKTWGVKAAFILAPFIAIPIWIVTHFRKIGGWFRSIWQTVERDVSGFIGRIVGWFESLPGRIARMAGAMLHVGVDLARGLWGGLRTIFTDAANIGRDLYNAVAGFINHDLIDPIKNWHFTIGAFGLHHTFQPFGGIPDIPYLATGGMTTGRTLAVIGDNASGNELVMPMDSPRTVDTLAKAMRKAQGNGGGGQGGGKIADTVNIYEAGDPQRTVREVARFQRARAAV